jgi:tetratricopeptide (TPR) repeat protein
MSLMQRAIDDYNEAIRLNPEFAYAYKFRGRSKSALEDKQGAIADYNEAIRLNPELDDAHTELADREKTIDAWNDIPNLSDFLDDFSE